MADIVYPTTLPDFSINKRRDTPQSIRVHTPLRGNAYTEQLFDLNDDTPAVFDVEIICKDQTQAQAFQAFLRTVDLGQQFTKSVLTETGKITHKMRFVNVPLQPTQVSENGQWSYRGTIYVDKLEVALSSIQYGGAAWFGQTFKYF